MWFTTTLYNTQPRQTTVVYSIYNEHKKGPIFSIHLPFLHILQVARKITHIKNQMRVSHLRTQSGKDKYNKRE